MADLLVLVAEDVGEANMARLRNAYPEIEFRSCLGRDALAAGAVDADIIFAKSLPGEAVRVARRLRWVQSGTAGIGGMLDAGLRESDVLLTNASGAHGVPIAELILSMMLAFATGLHRLIRGQRSRSRLFEAIIEEKSELEGQTICILGLGDIGGTLAQKAQKLGMGVMGVRRSAERCPYVDEQFFPGALLTALPRADHVALCLPLTHETMYIVGERELRAMKPSAHIYNVGRGGSIDSAALLRALSEGWISGAGLDVTEPEPLPEDSSLWDAPNVILSQHTSGSSPHNADRITAIFLENLGRYLRGEPLQNLVDKGLGY